ncbi:MAG TPA: hypothetical protein VJB39_01125 [Patescibacteria group bacterium]|nr:hypothetical protein [Patescibacteria group bacterium]
MKKTFFITGLFLFLLLIFLPQASLAAEGDCHLKHCLVPAPTLYTPKAGQTASARPAITGLTWKTTVVKVYLDGVELAGVKQIKHEDYYGSFYVRPTFNLKPGRHYVYTIAHSEKPSWYDQSQESAYVYFYVPEVMEETVINNKESAAEASRSAEALAKAEASDISEKEISQEAGEIQIVEPELDSRVDIIKEEQEGSVDMAEGQIEGGVYEEQKAESNERKTSEQTEELQEAATFDELGDFLEDELQEKKLADNFKRNRIVGIIILALIGAAVLIWLLNNKYGIRSQMKKVEEAQLPPPPQPPQQSSRPIQPSLPVKDEEIRIEPLPAEAEEPESVDDYWGVAPDSPYTIQTDEEDEPEIKR